MPRRSFFIHFVPLFVFALLPRTPLAPLYLRCIGGSSASTPVWFPELSGGRGPTGASWSGWAQAASQLKPATAFLLGTRLFFSMAATPGAPCGCGPAAQGCMCSPHVPLPMSFLLPFSNPQVSSTRTSSSTRRRRPAVHHLIIVSFAIVMF